MSASHTTARLAATARRGRRAGQPAATRRRRLLAPLVAMATVATGLAGVTATPARASVGQTYACAYWANVNIFETGYGTQGCAPQSDSGASANSLAPSLTLPEAGGNLSSTDIDGARAIYHDVANIFSSPYDPNDNLTNSGPLSVTVRGASGGVEAYAKAETVGPSPFWTRSPSSAGPYAEPAKSGSTYDGTTGFVESTCRDDGSGPVGSVRIKNGYVDTATGTDGYPTRTVEVPEYPSVGSRVDYTLDNVGDSGLIHLNEQIVNIAEGTLTVNAVRMEMQGVNAYGDLIIGQTVCGL